MESLRGMKLMLKGEDGKALACKEQVLFDTTKHFSEGALKRRDQESLKLQEVEEERKNKRRDKRKRLKSKESNFNKEVRRRFSSIEWSIFKQARRQEGIHTGGRCCRP